METEHKPEIVFYRNDLLFEAREITNQLKRHRAARFGPGKSSGLYDRFMRLVPNPDPLLRNALEQCLLCEVQEGLPLEEEGTPYHAFQFLFDYLAASYL